MTRKSQFFEKMSYEERMIWLGSQIIETDDVVNIGKMCTRLWRQSGLLPEGDAGFVFGETGAGKSTGVAAFADTKFDEMQAEQPNAEWLRIDVPGTPIRPIWQVVPGDGELRPLVVVVVNPKPTFKSLLRDTAFELNIGLAKQFDPGLAMSQIQKQLLKQKVKMIVFDEVQHITESGMSDYSAADVFKIMAKARVQVVCVGLESYRQVFKGKTKNKQLKRLKTNEITIGPLACTLDDFPPLGKNGKPATGFPETAYRRFCEVLDFRDDQDCIILPFDTSSELSHPHTALRLWRACDGYVGNIMKFLIAATDRALESGHSNLRLELMAEVYRDREQCDDDDNWFLMGWTEFSKRFDKTTKRNQSDDEDDKDDEDEGQVKSIPRSKGRTKRRKSSVFNKR